MPLRDEWIVEGTRLITPNGYGTLISKSIAREFCSVRYDEPYAGIEQEEVSRGELALASPFTVVRVLNVTGIGLVTGAVNYPNWEEAARVVREEPYQQDETLIGINCLAGHYISNREVMAKSQILQAWLDMHLKFNLQVFDSIQDAKKEWDETIGQLSGTTSHILCAFLLQAIDLVHGRIVAEALFTTMRVHKRERYV